VKHKLRALLYRCDGLVEHCSLQVNVRHLPDFLSLKLLCHVYKIDEGANAANHQVQLACGHRGVNRLFPVRCKSLKPTKATQHLGGHSHDPSGVSFARTNLLSIAVNPTLPPCPAARSHVVRAALITLGTPESPLLVVEAEFYKGFTISADSADALGLGKLVNFFHDGHRYHPSGDR